MDLKESLIENQSIVLNAKAATWKEAIRLAVEPLIKSKAVTEIYYDEIIMSTEEMGAYYILCPKMAMPHARPGEYVLKDSFSFVTLSSPVMFPGDQEVDILVCLAATSNENHLGNALPQIATLFSQEEVFEKIYRVKDQNELLQLIG
ncbi:PTS sugar transporter subunit IIA [Neobacillus niacini]|uniref:PTS sugar transporter subunit IIA n=1 Tax=Neobacillus niacini TaxID=86668 RepID=UPI0021CB2738|nr:PTS sugar transporter subunit IIA [Neobacillus niacini]MCM3763641.1 PTS sugar transporter subunit IIA [Neobacillus niacini]